MATPALLPKAISFSLNPNTAKLANPKQFIHRHSPLLPSGIKDKKIFWLFISFSSQNRKILGCSISLFSYSVCFSSEFRRQTNSMAMAALFNRASKTQTFNLLCRSNRILTSISSPIQTKPLKAPFQGNNFLLVFSNGICAYSAIYLVVSFFFFVE